MSQHLENLIELIRTVNEVYFITAPERVRAAYILVDDIVELSLKTFLYEHTRSQREQCQADFQAASLLTSNNRRNALAAYFDGTTEVANLAATLGNTEQAIRQRLAPYHHTPEQQANCKAEFSREGLLPSLVEDQAFDDYFSGAVTLTDFATALRQPEAAVLSHLKSFGDLRHWSINKPNQHVGFYTIVTDVKTLFPANSAESEMLQATLDRHESRNRLYHDHHHTAWSVSDIRCLRAMCDLFSLLELLFPDFNDTLTDPKHRTVRCQIGVLRLKLKSEEGNNEIVQPYKEALKILQKRHVYDVSERSIEHSILHTVSEDFFQTLRDQYDIVVNSLQVRVNELEQMMQNPRRKRKEHPGEHTRMSRTLNSFRAQLSEIEALLGRP